jgi:hypothetical protein
MKRPQSLKLSGWLLFFKTPLPAEVCYPVLTFLDPAKMERGLKYLENERKFNPVSESNS